MSIIDPRYLRRVDWSRSSLGEISSWPRSLKSYVGMILGLPTPAIVFWGPELAQIYNDGYAVILGPRHPLAMGQSFEACWPETYPIIHPWMVEVIEKGKVTEVSRAPITMTRHGFAEEAFFTFSLSPLRDDEGNIAGVYQPVMEMTEGVLRERRAETLRRVTARADVFEQFTRAGEDNAADIPFAAVYLARPHADIREAPLGVEASIGFAEAAAPDALLASLHAAVSETISSNTAVVVDTPPRVHRPWPEPVSQVFIAPVRRSAADEPLGVIVFGLSPRLRFDVGYREFLEALAREVGTAVAAERTARAESEWREREQNARRDAQEAHARRLSTLFEHAPVGIAVLRGPSFVFEVANPKYAALVGHRPLLQRPLGEALDELAGQGILELLEGVYRTGEPFYGHGIPVRVTSAEGVTEERVFDFAYEPVPGEDGKPESIIAVVFEVTDLWRARREAEGANRAKDEFFAILGHELRNPLAPIRTALQLMELRGNEAHLRERAIIERHVEQINRLVDDLLDVSRITGGKVTLKREPTELSQVVAKAIEMASPLLEERRHRLEVSVPTHGLVVDGDEARLAQIVSNLLTNAAKYTEPNGRIELAAAIVGPEDRLQLTVSDDGIGISKEMLPRVFEAFAQERQSIDRALGGLGLGLTIVANLVKLHGGTVKADSAGRGQGSTFTVELARSASQPEASSGHRPATMADLAAPDSAAASGASTLRVLVVDDNVDAAEMLSEALEMLGYETRIAHDGAEALRVSTEFVPDAALLDIGLPVMDGYELARNLRGGPHGKTLRLVAITGYGQESDRRKATQAGFDAHLVKPVQLRVVTELLARYLRERLVLADA